MSEKIYTIDEIRMMLRPLLERYHMASAGLFGSYARGEATTRSDIDVIVFEGDGATAWDVFGVAEGLHKASGKDVDVYEISELKDGAFKESVLQDLVAL